MAPRKGRLRWLLRREPRGKPAGYARAAKSSPAASPVASSSPSPSPAAVTAAEAQPSLALPLPPAADRDMAVARAHPPAPASSAATRITEVAPAEQSSRVLPVPPTGAVVVATAMAAASAAAPAATSRRRRGNQRLIMTNAAMQVVESSKYMDSAMALQVAEGAGAGSGRHSLRKYIRPQQPPPSATPWFKNFGAEGESKETLKITAAPKPAPPAAPGGRGIVRPLSEAPQQTGERTTGVLVLGPPDGGRLAALYEDVAAEAGSECTNSSGGMSGGRRSSDEDASRNSNPGSSPGGAYTKHFGSERKARWTMKRDQSWHGLDVASSVGDFESTVIGVPAYQPTSRDYTGVASPVDSVGSDGHDSMSLVSEAVPVPDISLVFSDAERHRMETLKADREMAERARREIAARRARDASATAASAAAADAKRRAAERVRIAAEKERKKSELVVPKVKKRSSFRRRRLALPASRGQAIVLGGDGVVGGVGVYRAS